MDTTAENVSGAGGAAPIVVADEPFGPVKQLLELATTPYGFVAILVLLALGFVSLRSRTTNLDSGGGRLSSQRRHTLRRRASQT